MIIHAENLHFSYRDRKAIKGVSLLLPEGGLLGVIGPNGAGKSTLLRLISGILKPDSGKILIGQRAISDYTPKQLARMLTMVPQDSQVDFPYKCNEFVMMGRYPYIGMFGFEGTKDIKIVKQCLEITDLKDMGERLYADLSGGEKKRVIIARALAQEPESLLLDEPTSALDIRYEIEVYNLLRRLNQNKKITIVIVTHNINFASLYCSRLVLMRDGSIFGIGNAVDIIKPEIIKDVYGIDVKINYDNETGVPYLLPKTIIEDINDILLFERPSTL